MQARVTHTGLALYIRVPSTSALYFRYMTDVQFNEPEYGTPARDTPPKASFADTLVAKGVVKTAKQGEYLLLSTAIVALLIAAYIFFLQIAPTARSVAVPEPTASLQQ